MSVLYNLMILLYRFVIGIVSLWNKKARLWCDGRRDIFKHMQEDIDDGDSIVWFHAASLGEFEQGRPIIEHCRKQYPECKILLTFFSPSGYEIRKDYQGADYIFYLPIDTKFNAKRFLNIVQPRFAVFIKYEFWFNYIQQLNKRNIPLYVVSAKFRADQHFFKTYGGWFRKGLKKITHFFVQDEASKSLLNNIGISQVDVSGDTRFDRVAEVINQPADYPLIEAFCKDAFVVVGGSTWPKDEELLQQILSKAPSNLKLLIAPHEIHQAHIQQIQKVFQKDCVLYSQANADNVETAKVLVIDAIGYLSKLYRYGKWAYIGGGFGVGIHNTLEAAAYGLPVAFGPNYHKFNEAVALVEKGGGFPIDDARSLQIVADRFLKDEDFLNQSAEIAGRFVQDQRGATAIFFERIKTHKS